MVSVALALLAAFTNALSSVLQRQANLDEADAPFGVSMLRHLLLRRAWLLGAGAMIVSFLLQAAALTLGALAVVQPLLAVELPIAVVLGASMLHRSLRMLDWLATVGMTGGLALMLSALAPRDNDPDHVPHWPAAVASIATAAAILALVVGAVGGRHRARAALLGVAAGAGFGLTAGLMKLAIVAARADGVRGLLSAWETYGVAVAGLASVVLVQAALHAGTLVSVQPGLTLTDPLVAIVWGTAVTGEHVRTAWPALLFAVAGAALIAAGAVWLARHSVPADVRPADASS